MILVVLLKISQRYSLPLSPYEDRQKTQPMKQEAGVQQLKQNKTTFYMLHMVNLS